MSLKSSPFIYLVLLSVIALISCDDDVRNTTVIPFCQDPTTEGIMTINEESYFLEISFIQNGSSTDMVRNFTISGFTEDCERRDEIQISYDLFNINNLTGTYTIASEINGNGTASGILLTQIVETLEQRDELLNSGTFTISEDEVGVLSITLEVETLGGDVVVIDSEIITN